nr:VOC family protein [uncultured Achromobacter sp.]
MEDKSYRARLVPELMVRDMAQSRRFWIDLCGFEVVYQREEEGFVFLDRDGAQFMLDEIRGDDGWITAPLQAPLGRGVNFEIKVKSIGPLYERLLAADWPMYRAMQQRWYRNGQIEIGVQQFLVQDPDGYLLRFSEWIGDRPVATVALSVAAAA